MNRHCKKILAALCLIALWAESFTTQHVATADESAQTVATAQNDCCAGHRRRARRRARRTCCKVAAEASQSVALFDGKTLNGWNVTDFAGHGEVRVENGQLILGTGEGLTGVNWKGKDLPKLNYEISLEAKRTEGTDIFCGLTFPVGDSFCSFIAGGWGGGVVGLSSLDDFDASENESSSHVNFKENRWYRFRVVVRKDNISAWIDDKKIVDQDIKGRKVSVRIDIEDAQPLGISSWASTAAIRNFRLKKLPSDGS